MKALDTIKFNADGLVPVIAQDADNGEILMVAYMNKESLKRSIETGVATYWSRSRQKFWVKGESSGHIQKIKQILVDCDADAIIIKIHQAGVACHEGYRSCFFREITENGEDVKLIMSRDKNPDEIYNK